MAFDNHYPNRKDRRREYRKSKRFDRSCRNHGGCPYCEANRLYNSKVQQIKLDEDLKRYLRGEDDLD